MSLRAVLVAILVQVAHCNPEDYVSNCGVVRISL
jgi:hypothetical protein